MQPHTTLAFPTTALKRKNCIMITRTYKTLHIPSFTTRWHDWPVIVSFLATWFVFRRILKTNQKKSKLWENIASTSLLFSQTIMIEWLLLLLYPRQPWCSCSPYWLETRALEFIITMQMTFVYFHLISLRMLFPWCYYGALMTHCHYNNYD